MSEGEVVFFTMTEVDEGEEFQISNLQTKGESLLENQVI